MYAERFLDASVEIRELTGLGERGVKVDWCRGCGYWLEVCIQLVLQLRIAAGGAQYIVENRGQCYSAVLGNMR